MGMSRAAGDRAASELPLALPLIMTGIRTAAVQVVATATLAALVGGGRARPDHPARLRPAGLRPDHRRRPPRRRPGAADRGAPRRCVSWAGDARARGGCRVPGRAVAHRWPTPEPTAVRRPALRPSRRITDAATRSRSIACTRPTRGCDDHRGSPPARHACVPSRPPRDTEGGRHAHAHPDHRPPRPRPCCSPRACGESGSSGTGGEHRAATSREAVGRGLRPGRRRPARRPRGRPGAAERRQHHPGGQRRRRPRPTRPCSPALNAVSAALTTEDLVEHERRRRRRAAERRGRRGRLGRGERRHRRASSRAAAPIVVGGASFTESTILANVYADVLTAAGLRRLGAARSAAASSTSPALQDGRDPGLPGVPGHR